MEADCRVDLLLDSCVQQDERRSRTVTDVARKLVDASDRCSWFRLSICLPLDTASTSSFGRQINNENNDNNTCLDELIFFRNKHLLGDKLQSLYRLVHLKSCGHFEAVTAKDKHNSLSVCSTGDISGIFRLGTQVYRLHYTQEAFYLSSIHPTLLSNSCEGLYKLTQRVRRKRAVNGDGWQAKGSPSFSVPEYYQRYVDGIRRYVELVFVADNSIYQKYNKDAAKIHDRLQSIASIVNSLYAPLNIRVTLVWADIWIGTDAVEVNSQADQTLARFVAYRNSELLADHPNDNAHLITDVRFGEVIGKAYRGTMCSYGYSGGVIVDHSPHVAFVGSTVAHEMGHNFGMDHDSGYPVPCACAGQQCIMAPASSNYNVSTYFSDCSLDALDAALKRGVDYCLLNVPEMAFGGAKCGNGVLEDGEECDCGSTKLCPNRCCIAATCRLASEAECADGDCCDVQTCKPRPAANVCRNATNSCDLPEYCDGQNPVCPPDFFIQNGLQCPDDSQGFCYDGHCGSRTQQCRLIWGPTAENSVEQCYAYNRGATFGGNCGYDPDKNRYLPCLDKDVQCGRLQCQHSSEKPMFGDPSAIFSVYKSVHLSDGNEAACRTVRTTYTGSGGRSHKMRDPGLVPDGAKCGDGKMCLDTRCRNHSEVTQMVKLCEPPDCNGKGVCNNVGNCHCVPGYGGPGCDIPGFGGSVNSGPATDEMFNPGLVLAYFLLVGLIAFVCATYYCKRHKDYWLHKKMWRAIRNTLNIRSNVRVPVRRAPPIPNVSIQHHRFSFNALWGDSPSKKSFVPVSPPSVAAHYSAPSVEGVVPRPLIQNNSASALLNSSANVAHPTTSWMSDNTPLSLKPVGLFQQTNVEPQLHQGNIWMNSLDTEAKLEGRCAFSPSSSSSSNKTAEISKRKPLKPSANDMVSNRQLMEEIKKSIEQPSFSVNSSQSSGVLKNLKEMPHDGVTSSKFADSRSASPPPLPRHRSYTTRAKSSALATKNVSPTPEKPKLKKRNSGKEKMPNNSGVSREPAQYESFSAQSPSLNEEDDERSTPLSVRELTAKFNAPK